jgi:RNA polymerase sigma-70 factor (family 1)
MMAEFKTYSDDAILKLLKVQDMGAFDEIYRRYWKKLYSMCYRRLQSREISEELVQDIFTGLWASRNSSSIGNLSAYLCTAVKYKVINHMAREMSRKSYSIAQLSNVYEGNSTEEAVLLDDLNTALEKAIDKLPAKRQMIFKLHRQGNLSVKQVASQLGISEKTVENQYGKAMKMLKISLKHFTSLSIISMILAIR